MAVGVVSGRRCLVRVLARRRATLQKAAACAAQASPCCACMARTQWSTCTRVVTPPRRPQWCEVARRMTHIGAHGCALRAAMQPWAVWGMGMSCSGGRKPPCTTRAASASAPAVVSPAAALAIQAAPALRRPLEARTLMAACRPLVEPACQVAVAECHTIGNHDSAVKRHPCIGMLPPCRTRQVHVPTLHFLHRLLLLRTLYFYSYYC